MAWVTSAVPEDGDVGFAMLDKWELNWASEYPPYMQTWGHDAFGRAFRLRMVKGHGVVLIHPDTVDTTKAELPAGYWKPFETLEEQLGQNE